MLTRQKPYRAENPMAIIYKHRKAPMPQLPASFARRSRCSSSCWRNCPRTALPAPPRRPRRSRRRSRAGARGRARDEDRACGEPAAPQGILAVATPAAWVKEALAHWPELLLDHANCEKKAASTALALMFAYPEDRALSVALSRLAREELRHFEQVAAALSAAGVAFRRQRPGRYARSCAPHCARPTRAASSICCSRAH